MCAKQPEIKYGVLNSIPLQNSKQPGIKIFDLHATNYFPNQCQSQVLPIFIKNIYLDIHKNQLLNVSAKIKVLRQYIKECLKNTNFKNNVTYLQGLLSSSIPKVFSNVRHLVLYECSSQKSSINYVYIFGISDAQKQHFAKITTAIKYKTQLVRKTIKQYPHFCGCFAHHHDFQINLFVINDFSDNA